MKISHTAIIHYLSQVTTAIIGFLATIYFARVLGADKLGNYYLILMIVSWLRLVSKVGISSSIIKRMSESEDQIQYAIAGSIMIYTFFGLITICLLVFQGPIEEYVNYPAIFFIIVILFIELGYSVVSAVLSGCHLVHISGALSPVGTASRSLSQVVAVAMGLGISGLLVGYSIGWAIAVLVGLGWILSLDWEFSLPERHHFEHLFSFAKFSWLGNLRGRTIQWMDIAVLGLFSTSDLVGIYTVCWTIIKFLSTFSESISSAMFPEISSATTESGANSEAALISQAVAYGGLLIIPGCVGGILLSESLLNVYSSEFVRGSPVLIILLVGGITYVFQGQFLNFINALDHPEKSFKINASLILVNTILNLVLVYYYGWLGAAVATSLTTSFGAVSGYIILQRTLQFQFPFIPVRNQIIASTAMGAIIYIINTAFDPTYVNETVTTVTVVGIGAGVYFVLLLLIWPEFKQTTFDVLLSPLIGNR